MTKKDYIAVAKVIHKAVWTTGTDLPTITQIVGDLAVVFAANNPRFDRARFMSACFDYPVEASTF